MSIKVMHLDQLTDHDVYEFCYAENYSPASESFWHQDSIYFSCEDFKLLQASLDPVFPTFHYYGPQKVTLAQWQDVINISTANQCSWISVFEEIQCWLRGNGDYGYFWILGV